MGDVEALKGVGMQRPRLGEVEDAGTRKPDPADLPFVSTPMQRLQPGVTQPVAKEPKIVKVSRYGMVIVEARANLVWPLCRDGDRSRGCISLFPLLTPCHPKEPGSTSVWTFVWT
jgi:hypothetical protein